MKKSKNFFNSIKAYLSLFELEWLSQKISKKFPNLLNFFDENKMVAKVV